jgi:heme-degrading monooxygenase HmoA
MIARSWHGAVPAAKAEAYHQYLLRTGVPGVRGTPGNLGVTILRRIEKHVAHFQFISYWTSLDAILAFAGDDIEVARYYPEDAGYLLEQEPNVTHYEVLEPPGLPG